MAGEVRPVAARVYRPALMLVGGRFEQDLSLAVDENGTITAISRDPVQALELTELPGRALLPGMVDVHSHSFQRSIRGKVESRKRNGPDFWSWRETMYHCALRLSPEDVYSVARMAFLEMLLAGITTVGEFHYLHRAPDGSAYSDPNLLGLAVIRAARDTGMRIVLLRSAYVRGGFRKEIEPGQRRFIESTPDEFLKNTEALISATKDDSGVTVGIAPHSIRAVPLHYLRHVSEWACLRRVPVHMHVAEQPGELAESVAEYGAPPVRLLAEAELLHDRFTAVHAIHMEADEVRSLADARVIVCSCPTTERNLGDGILAADQLLRSGIRIALGTDSHTQTDALENARELEYHLRLRDLERAVLETVTERPLAAELFDSATVHGASALGLNCGALQVGAPADFFTVDREDASIAGSDRSELLTNIVLSLSKRAIRDVAVDGRLVIHDGQHAGAEEIVRSYAATQQRLAARS